MEATSGCLDTVFAVQATGCGGRVTASSGIDRARERERIPWERRGERGWLYYPNDREIAYPSKMLTNRKNRGQLADDGLKLPTW